MATTMKMIDGAADTCPRCLGALRQSPSDAGARSRVTADRDITICGPCGTDEANRQFLGNGMVPSSDWPILNGPHDYRPVTSHG